MATLAATKLDLDPALRPAFIDAVETGCLLHDIGNPPFGHFGEDAIKSWAENTLVGLRGAAPESESLADFRAFDGNAQGLRMIARLQSDFDEFGLNLTYGQIAAVIKYPFTGRHLTKNNLPIPKPAYASKIGVFSSDWSLVESVWSEVGLREHRRSPLVYLVEAADDIAYGLSDIEDALETRTCSHDDLFRYLETSGFEPVVSDLAKGAKGDFVRLRVAAAKKMTAGVVEIYHTNQRAILSGNFEAKSLVDASAELAALRNAFSKTAQKFAYKSRAAELPEMAGLHAVSGLLRHLEPILRLSGEDTALLLNGNKRRAFPLEARLLALMPSKHVRAYQTSCRDNPDQEWWWRTHLLVDFVVGMTDSYAVELYQVLSGIRLS